MLAEKLLLHVLIILAPVLIYSVLFENRRLGKSPYIIGLLYAISAFLCLIFAYYDYDLFWDLRYVPLVLSILYGGPISGIMVVLSILIARTYLGGDSLLYGYISILLSAVCPFIISKYFMKLSKRKRIWTAILLGFWPELVQLFVLYTHQMFQYKGSTNQDELLSFISIFGCIQALGISIAAWLHEAIIERVLIKKEIQRAEKLNILGELAASIAHEVRNPLTVVKGFLQLMQKEEKGRNFEYLSLVLSELGRAEGIISDYLNFAKPQYQKLEVLKLDHVVSEVTILLDSIALKNGVKIDCDLEENIYYQTDKNQLKQALVNLIKNAIEATSNGGNVFVKLAQEEEYILIIIQDNGKGMSKEQLSRIGTLFYTTKDKGTGLGTTVSIKIIESMNGRIEYKSEVNVGTEIQIILPKKRELNVDLKKSVV